jgi:hypothetical protein
MSDASLALQCAIVTLLKADGPMTALVGPRIFDNVPASADFPYVTVGEDQVLPDLAQNYDGNDVITTLHGWSRAIGFPEVKQIGAAINAALNAATFSLSGFRVVEFVQENTHYLRDPDGETRHGVFVYRARTEPI